MLNFKGYILPLSVQSKNSGESAICIQKGSLRGNLLDNRKEGELGNPASQTKASQWSGLYGNKGAFSVQLSVRQEENEKYFLDGEPKCEAIFCYFRYQTSFWLKCIFRRCGAFSLGTIVGSRKNTKFIVVNHFSFFLTLQLVPRSHAVDGCSLRPTAL